MLVMLSGSLMCYYANYCIFWFSNVHFIFFYGYQCIYFLHFFLCYFEHTHQNYLKFLPINANNWITMNFSSVSFSTLDFCIHVSKL